MTRPAALFRFRWLIAAADRGGYYMTRWDQGVEVVTYAATKAAAWELAKQVLGDPPAGEYWTGRLPSIRRLVVGEGQGAIEPVPDVLDGFHPNPRAWQALQDDREESTQ